MLGFEKVLGAVKVIKDQIQYRSQSLLNLARDYFAKMDYENMRVAELKALARECGLRGYSRLRKAELIAFLQERSVRVPEPRPIPPPSPATRCKCRGILN